MKKINNKINKGSRKLNLIKKVCKNFNKKYKLILKH